MPINSYQPTVRPASYDLIDQAFNRFVAAQTPQPAQPTQAAPVPQGIPDFFKPEGQTRDTNASIPDQPFTPPAPAAQPGAAGGGQNDNGMLALLAQLLGTGGGENQGRRKIVGQNGPMGPQEAQQAYFNQANPFFQLQSQFAGQGQPVQDIFNLGNYQRQNPGGTYGLNDQTRQNALTYILQQLAGGGQQHA